MNCRIPGLDGGTRVDLVIFEALAVYREDLVFTPRQNDYFLGVEFICKGQWPSRRRILLPLQLGRRRRQQTYPKRDSELRRVHCLSARLFIGSIMSSHKLHESVYPKSKALKATFVNRSLENPWRVAYCVRRRDELLLLFYDIAFRASCRRCIKFEFLLCRR